MSETTTRPKRRTLHATVVSAERLTPQMVRVVVSGDELDGFGVGAFTDHYVKVQLPPPGAGYAAPFDPEELKAQLPREHWPRTRSYTVRAWDAEHNLLTLDFVVHGDEGVAGPWARAAKPGDILQLMGPGGAYTPDPDAAWHLMVGDLSVLPAIGASLQRVPEGVPVHVLVELDDEADRQELTSPGRPARHVAARRRHGHRAGRGGPRARVPRRAGARLRPRRGVVRARRAQAPAGRPRGPARGAVGVRLLEAHADRRGVARGQGGVEPPRRAGRHLAGLAAPTADPRRILPPVAKNAHPQASIDWASAEVRGGDLTVALAGEANAEWAERVQAIVERLDRPGSAWGATKVTKAKVTVEAVGAGAEEDLRHLLDGAVQQANADYAPEEKDDAGDEPSEADAAMTEAFRSFAQAPSD